MLLDSDPKNEFDIKKYDEKKKRMHLTISPDDEVMQFEAGNKAARQEVTESDAAETDNASEETPEITEQKDIYVGYDRQ